MNKAELVAAMAEQAGLSKKDAEAALKAFTDVVSDELKNGGKVQLVVLPPGRSRRFLLPDKWRPGELSLTTVLQKRTASDSGRVLGSGCDFVYR